MEGAWVWISGPQFCVVSCSGKTLNLDVNINASKDYTYMEVREDCLPFSILEKKLNIDLPYNPVIVFLNIHPDELKAYVHTKSSTRLLIETLFIIGKNE